MTLTMDLSETVVEIGVTFKGTRVSICRASLTRMVTSVGECDELVLCMRASFRGSYLRTLIAVEMVPA